MGCAFRSVNRPLEHPLPIPRQYRARGKVLSDGAAGAGLGPNCPSVRVQDTVWSTDEAVGEPALLEYCIEPFPLHPLIERNCSMPHVIPHEHVKDFAALLVGVSRAGRGR